MCGIAGFFSAKHDASHLEKANKLLHHRGPDQSGIYLNENVGLAHRRLSILDLSERGKQPMASKDGNLIMVYNGEVYNFKELATKYNIQTSSTSDTEVILACLEKIGPDVVNEFNGMFSIALYNKQENSLMLFRDRMGIKPLFYFWNGKELVFSSELKVIQALIPVLEVNMAAVADFLHLAFIPAPKTIYNNTFKLEPGHYLSLKNGQVSIKKYWAFEDKMANIQDISFEEAKVQLHEKLVQSVQYRMISDVPLGTFLSGGIDSSLVTAIAQSQSAQPLKTFTIGFKDSGFDESSFAERSAQKLGTEHHTFMLSTEEMKDKLLHILDVYDEPFGDSSAIPTMMVSEMAAQHVKVVLSGDGGDELFWGYNRYKWAKRLQSPMLSTFKKPLSYILDATGKTKLKYLASNLKSKKGKFASHLFSQQALQFSEDNLQSLLNVDLFSLSKYQETFTRNGASCGQIENQTLFDTKYYLPDDNLTKVDRASMLYSLEARVPLLDHNIVEFALNLPHQYKLAGSTEKHILKEVLYKYLPKDYFERPKQGFSIPLAQWLKGDLKFLQEEYLSQQMIESHGILNFNSIQSIKEEFNKGNHYHFNKLWSAILLQKWFTEKG